MRLPYIGAQRTETPPRPRIDNRRTDNLYTDNRRTDDPCPDNRRRKRPAHAAMSLLAAGAL
ncbi:MAG: hypothetical protein HXO70_04410, partial [Rothia sp.]|nr:hypothetical protein [Rothia sp. (in: high G+C Gram-positive bacteria)]